MDTKATGIFANVILIVGMYKLAQKLGIFKSEEDKLADQMDLSGQAFDPNFWQQFNWSTVKQNTIYIWALPAAKAIKNSLGFFTDDFDRCFAEFKKCKTQAECSFLCDVFQYEFGVDLVTYLKDGDKFNLNIFSGFNNSDLSKIAKYIYNLPKN